MGQDGTFEDHFTLQAASNIFNVQTVHSSLGAEANTLMSPITEASVSPFANFNLGHFAEGQGKHYVCLEPIDNAAEKGSNEWQEDQEGWSQEESPTEKEEIHG